MDRRKEIERQKLSGKGTNPVSVQWLMLYAALFVTLASPAVLAQPFIPASDDQVLAVLPDSSKTFAASATSPSTGTVITDAERVNGAQLLLQHAYKTSDEDAFGQAEALLTIWSEGVELADIPLEVQYMLAVIRQHDHEFLAALELLNQLLNQQPNNGAALLQRAQINLVLGNYEASKNDCQQLVRLASNASYVNCIAQVRAVTGQAREVHAQLAALVALEAALMPADHIELLLTLATVSHRLGLTSDAENYYKDILDQNDANLYAVLQYSDFLLEQDRFVEVLQLLNRLNAQQMTLELQVKQMEALFFGGRETNAYATAHQQLEEIFRVAQTRAENFPHKEYARFLLPNSREPLLALEAARANWQYQKEPGDLLLLVRAAVAANSIEDLDLAKEWLLKTGLEDIRISQLLEDSSVRNINPRTGSVR